MEYGDENPLAGYVFWCDHTMKKGFQGFSVEYERLGKGYRPRVRYWSAVDHHGLFLELPMGFKIGKGYNVHGKGEPLKNYG